MNNTRNFSGPVEKMKTAAPVKLLLTELCEGLTVYRNIAREILETGGVALRPAEKDYCSFEKNFFSLLFLYSFYRAEIPPSRRVLYAVVLQCLRGMVTGCDNLLDDEYKITLDTNIPEKGFRFRSVVDIMVSDRVLFHVLQQAAIRGEIEMDRLLSASTASMKTMMRSGVQEASEESGITSVLTPDELLKTIHHYKTGLLFQCPWDIPLIIEDISASKTAPLLESLYKIGMGCQIMDDIVDFESDIGNKRHNFLVSLIHFGNSQDEISRLNELLGTDAHLIAPIDPVRDFPQSVATAAERSYRFLKTGLACLFSGEDQFLVEPSIHFLIKKIGVNLLQLSRKP